MQVRLVFVPPGGGEAECTSCFELPAVPAIGDYISIVTPGKTGAGHYIVRRTWWTLQAGSEVEIMKLDGDFRTPAPRQLGMVCSLHVECEFAKGPFSSEGHKRACQRFEKAGKPIKSFDESGY